MFVRRKQYIWYAILCSILLFWGYYQTTPVPLKNVNKHQTTAAAQPVKDPNELRSTVISDNPARIIPKR